MNESTNLIPAPETGVALSFVDQVRANIAELEQAILAAHPTMPQLLRQIHTQLKKDPEVTTLLEEDEIGVVVQGLVMLTNTEVGAAKEAKNKKKPVSLDIF